ncbi:uncharacterized protein BO96DRAFT_436775 [Aspergillus niger CBS 101883]|uniref:uncharacterized protein n=1 Tax=Aspergillus lacticoffeatus (strain CBS 101883) TaxID=1450533 RepID=UPI000D7F4845|nr:uncharacterized protein BO96DRAFT_436775 [Aspergillus niger CBS 101883]PYH53870.1 hypothetical protein BO96DRAFT_436775 [Aspergillus niger CBS 101883]
MIMKCINILPDLPLAAGPGECSGTNLLHSSKVPNDMVAEYLVHRNPGIMDEQVIMPRTVLQDYLGSQHNMPREQSQPCLMALSSHGSVRDDRRSRSPIQQEEQDMMGGILGGSLPGRGHRPLRVMTFLGKVAVSESWMTFGFDRRFQLWMKLPLDVFGIYGEESFQNATHGDLISGRPCCWCRSGFICDGSSSRGFLRTQPDTTAAAAAARSPAPH